MSYKHLLLIATGIAALGTAQAQSQAYDSAPQVDIAAMEAANMQPPVKKVVKKPAPKHKTTVKRSSSSKKHSKHHTHVADCDPKPEVVTCTMPTKP